MSVPPEEESDEFAASGASISEFAEISHESEIAQDEEREILPLRLADVPDLAPLTPVPLIPPSPMPAPSSAAFDPVLPEDDVTSGDWLTTFAIGSGHPQARTSSDGSVQVLDDGPILVIEEDSSDRPGGRPQVRRQEYRNLFSRLRSG
jgi:hypothetical protein